MTNDPNVLTKYIAGFNECTSEVTKYLNSMEGLSPEMRTRLLNHLANSLQRSSISMAASSAASSVQLQMNQTCNQPLGIQIPAATQLSTLPGSGGGLCVLSPGNCNPQIQTISASPMQLVPAKLPTGDTVFLLANPQSLAAPGSGLPLVSTVLNNNTNMINNNNSNLSLNNSVANIEPSQTSTPKTSDTLSTPLSDFPSGSASFKREASSPSTSTSRSRLASQEDFSSPDLQPSHSRSATVSYDVSSRDSPEDWPRRIPSYDPRKRCSDGQSRHTSDSSEDDEDDDSDIMNNNDQGLDKGPMWRPW